MASAAIDFGVGRILSVLENEVLQQAGLSEEIEMMKQKLRFMKSFLEQRGNTSNNDDSVFTTFVKETRDLAFQIENIIDEFSYCINRRRGQTCPKRVLHFPIYMWKRRSIVGELQTKNRKVKEMSDLMNTFRPESSRGALPPVGDSGDKRWVTNIRESAFFTGDDSLVGIDDDKEKLTRWLLDPEPQRIVVTVVGIGGSGKTTLAGSIFRSQRVRKHFDSFSSVAISKSYDIEDVLRTIIRDFYKEPDLQVPNDLSSLKYRQLVEMLVNCVQHKRYLIVLDDVWSTEFWSEISVALPNGIHGNRVMITTREERVANFPYGSTSRIHEVKCLSGDKPWELFCKKAFPGNLAQSIKPKVLPTARNLVDKCEGLPLAIVALGSMMSTRRSESEWRKVNDSLNWELRNNPYLKEVKLILVLSFDDLPYPLKHCFLYCSIFPEDYIIKRSRLIRMWMAQGFVESNREKPEAVANSYLMELVYRNLLQVVSRNVHGQPKEFKMHDMVREVALGVSKEERFCDVYNDRIEESQNNETRHLCIQRQMSSGTARQNLRTLLVCSASGEAITVPLGLKHLRVLDLQDTNIEDVSDSLVNLFNLKYLNVKGTRMIELPESLHKLVNLETLITLEPVSGRFPAGISKMRNLRYLIADSGTSLSTKDCSDCWQLKRLRVMVGICAETQLIKSLSKMTQLTKIGLTGVRKDHGNDLCDSLSKLKDLRSLSLTSMVEEEPLPIDALSPATNVEKLRLDGKLDRVPSWFKTLHKLTRLRLVDSYLEEDPIPCIQSLPNLVELYLWDAYEGDTLCFPEGGFHSLKVLDIGSMRQLRDMVIQKGAMPHLQQLHIKYCNGLNRVPDGIESLSNLQNLSLIGVSDEAIEKIRGEDRSKVDHITGIQIFNSLTTKWENIES